MSNFVNNTSDEIPPGRITDLTLTAAIHTNQSFRLSWSQPADDGFSHLLPHHGTCVDKCCITLVLGPIITIVHNN